MSALLGMPWQEILPWIAVIVVYLGEKIQQIILTYVLRDALSKAQTPPKAPSPPAVPTLPTPTPAPQPTPVPPQHIPAPISPYAECPWVKLALHEIGFHETGNNQGLDRYIAMAHTGSEGDPWCAIFANAMLEQASVTGTRSPAAQSFRTNPNFVQLSAPARGAITVFWRISKTSGMGHVGFYWGEDSTRVWTLGGNENNMVQIEALPKEGESFGLIGYWWPKGAPLPRTGAVAMPAESAVSIQSEPPDASTPAAAPANGLQTNIVATVFGGQKSAYGPPIDDNLPGVALPYRFKGTPRPRVNVINPRTGASVDCDIIDIGPWNINDPYWETGSRPQAESGTDLGQASSSPRRTNKSGIDLTVAAAKALGIDGKGLVNWQFIDSPDIPKVV